MIGFLGHSEAGLGERAEGLVDMLGLEGVDVGHAGAGKIGKQTCRMMECLRDAAFSIESIRELEDHCIWRERGPFKIAEITERGKINKPVEDQLFHCWRHPMEYPQLELMGRMNRVHGSNFSKDEGGSQRTPVRIQCRRK